MFDVSILIKSLQEIWKSTNFLLNVNLKKFILSLQLAAQLTAFDFMTTRQNKGSPPQVWVANTVSTEVVGLVV